MGLAPSLLQVHPPSKPRKRGASPTPTEVVNLFGPVENPFRVATVAVKRRGPTMRIDEFNQISDLAERANIAFPRLSGDMMSRVACYGSEQSFARDETIFSRGARTVDLFVVLEGEIGLCDFDRTGSRVDLATVGQCQFTGELDLLNGRQNLFSCRAHKYSRVLRIKRAEFQRLIRPASDIP